MSGNVRESAQAGWMIPLDVLGLSYLQGGLLVQEIQSVLEALVVPGVKDKAEKLVDMKYYPRVSSR